jgi:hypothetical protein
MICAGVAGQLPSILEVSFLQRFQHKESAVGSMHLWGRDENWDLKRSVRVEVGPKTRTSSQRWLPD